MLCDLEDIYQPNFADKNLVSFFIQSVYLWIYDKDIPKTVFSKLLKQVLKTKSFTVLINQFGLAKDSIF